MKTREQIIEEKNKLYSQIWRDLNPLVKKYGKNTLRLALNRWADKERRKRILLRRKREIEQELAEL